MEYEFILVEKKEHLTIVTLNRPEVMNALHPYIQLELGQVFKFYVLVVTENQGCISYGVYQEIQAAINNGIYIYVLREGVLRRYFMKVVSVKQVNKGDWQGKYGAVITGESVDEYNAYRKADELVGNINFIY